MMIKQTKQEPLQADNKPVSMETEIILTEEMLTELQKNAQKIEISTESQKALYAMGYSKYEQGKYQDAKLFFQFLTMINSLDHRYWMGLAVCHQKLKNYLQAVECYSVVALQDYENPYIPFHAAECYFASNQPEKGLLALNSAINTAEKSPSYHSLLAQLKLIQASWTGKNTRAVSQGAIS